MMHRFVSKIIIILLISMPVTAHAGLSQKDIVRLKKAVTALSGMEERPLSEIITEFENSGMPQDHLEIYEAIARTFEDIVTKYGNDSKESKEQLLSKIQLNMAYFQLGGAKAGEDKNGSELNRLIQRKLKHYLSKDIWENKKLFHTLE